MEIKTFKVHKDLIKNYLYTVHRVYEDGTISIFDEAGDEHELEHGEYGVPASCMDEVKNSVNNGKCVCWINKENVVIQSRKHYYIKINGILAYKIDNKYLPKDFLILDLTNENQYQ